MAKTNRRPVDSVERQQRLAQRHRFEEDIRNHPLNRMNWLTDEEEAALEQEIEQAVGHLDNPA